MFKKEFKGRPLWVILKARSLKRVPMRLLRWSKGMKSTTKYNLVPNDEFDTRIPLHSDEAFEYGITFQAKYIGTMDVPRPTNRVEIVAAMRRVRYEFKARGVKKRKVVIAVSTNGVRVSGFKKTGKRKPSKLFRRGSKLSTEGPEIMNHPIYRIFYVSHDSSDLKIFSYIARDGPTNVFKCNVFKSNRKNQAMKIVRTVGQAFEVCHKMKNNTNQQAPSTSSAIDEPVASDRFSDIAASKEMASECGASESGAGSSKAVEDMMNFQEPVRPKILELLPPPPRKEKRSSQRLSPVPPVTMPELPECITKVELPLDTSDANTPLSAQHQLQLFKEQLEQQAQQTQAAVAQLLLLRDQLAAEQAARCEAQARTHQLLVSNKELLEHIAALVAHLQDQERGILQPINAQQLTLLPQNKTSNGVGGTEIVKGDGNRQDRDSDGLMNLLSSPKSNQNLENNNLTLSPLGTKPPFPEVIEGISPAPSFGEMTNEQIQNYLVAKFQHMGGFTVAPEIKNNNQQFFQNCKAFPHIPPFANPYSNADISNLLQSSKDGSKYCIKDEGQDIAQAMSVGQSDNSLFSTSQPTTSQDTSPSSEEGVPFIMPLSQNGTLTATGDDGRVRVIVPVSPSESTTDVPNKHQEENAFGSTLQVRMLPGLAPPAPITRTTSEKVPNRSEMMAAMRSQWTRHTTK